MMYCISVNHGGVVWSFMYRTEETARVAHEKLRATPVLMAPIEAPLSMENSRLLHEKQPYINPAEIVMLIEISDDYGQVGTFRSKDISGVLFEDFDLSRGAHVERTIHATKVQLEAQKRLHSDPSVRAASPAVLAPGMNGGLIR